MTVTDSAGRDLAAIREALISDGYDPPPFAGMVFRDHKVPWLDDDMASYVLVTRLGPTVNGWQARVARWEQPASEPLTPEGREGGILFLDHLLGRRFRDVFDFRFVAEGDWDWRAKKWTERRRVAR
jgi:hypothetical protein